MNEPLERGDRQRLEMNRGAVILTEPARSVSRNPSFRPVSRVRSIPMWQAVLIA
jgi:hypothetical protein